MKKGNTIKIARISGEFKDEFDDVAEYLTPHTGFDYNHWFEFNEGKKVFDSIEFNNLIKGDGKEVVKEYRMTKAQKEFNVLDHNREGFKPLIYLFTFEIPEYIWKNKEEFAKQSGLGDDIMEYITLYTNYNWDLEIEREVKIPKKLVKTFDNFMWIQENKVELQLKYMQFLVETGGDDDMTLEKFETFIATEARDIIEDCEF